MSCIELELMELLEDPAVGFTNAQGVTFTADFISYDKTEAFSNSNLSLGASYPGFDDNQRAVSLELYKDFNLLKEFIEEFNILDISDLERFTPMLLLELYKKGEASVFCLYGDNYACFRKDGNELLVSDYGENEIAITQALQTTDDFIDYTKRHHF